MDKKMSFKNLSYTACIVLDKKKDGKYPFKEKEKKV